MTDKSIIESAVAAALEGTQAFVVDITVSRDNDIVVEIDSPDGIDLDLCEAVSRAVEAAVPREPEDYSLEVGSAGLTAPFKVRGQYLKNVGRPVEVLTRDGRKLAGTLVEVGDGSWPDFSFTVEVPRKVRLEGEKRPRVIQEPVTLTPAECKLVTYDIDRD